MTTIVFSLWRWTGDYYTKDIPNGVEVAPHTGSIYTIQADGSGLTEVFSRPGKDANIPTFTADGLWIVFQSDVSGRHQIYRCRPNGSDLVNLTAGDRLGAEWQEAYGFSLSANGQRMVYTVHNGKIGRAVVANADGSDPRWVAPHLGYTYMGALSPRGDRIVFSGPADDYRLKLLDLATDTLTDLTPDHPASYVPQFTSDGQTIFFIRRDGDIYRVEAASGPVQRLTTGNNYVRFRLSALDQHGSSDGPAVAPDGSQIAYISTRGGVANIWVMDLDGQGQRQLTFRDTPCGRVRWSPDGRSIAFVSFVGPYPQLFIVDVAGGEPRQLTHLDGAVYNINWKLPDSSNR